MGPRDCVSGEPEVLAGKPGAEAWRGQSAVQQGRPSGCRAWVPGGAWKRASAPGSGPLLPASPPAAAGPRTVRWGARTQGAGLPAARGKVELGEVGSGGGAPRGGHGGVVGSARGRRRRGRDPETPGARNPEQAGKRGGGGGGGPGPWREEGRGEGERGTRDSGLGGSGSGRKGGDWGAGKRDLGGKGWGGDRSAGRKRDPGSASQSSLRRGCRAPCHQEGVVSGRRCQPSQLPGGLQTTPIPYDPYSVLLKPSPRVARGLARNLRVKRKSREGAGGGESGQDKGSGRSGSSWVGMGTTSP